MKVFFKLETAQKFNILYKSTKQNIVWLENSEYRLYFQI